MSELFYGSVCLTDLIEHAKAKHSAFYRGKDGKVYGNVNVWLNDNLDKYGNIMSMQLNPTKEMKDIDKKFYIANFKKSTGPKPIGDRDASNLDSEFDVPTRTVDGSAPASPAANASDITEPVDDLPF